MFTGIIQDVGEVSAIEDRGGDQRLVIAARRFEFAACKLGDSIAVNGVCLTVVALDRSSFAADVSRETLSLTTLGSWRVGSRVNLEAALRVGDALGGHLVSGHIDGVGRIEALLSDARSRRITVSLPESLGRYVVRKGSIALDGVSLTVNEVTALEVEPPQFGVNLVPHTLAATTFAELAVGQRVNIEIDQVARYVARLLGRD